MSKASLHVLSWSEDQQRYELSTSGHYQQRFGQQDTRDWQNWLTQHTSFAFQGQHGHISVLKENRSRGAGYWYAYSTRDRRTNKRYLGSLSMVTLDRLEEAAQALAAKNVAEPRTNIHHLPGVSPLLVAKQAPPQLPAALVQRERLLNELDTVFTRRLLLLSASAGSGKTTLLSTWATHSIRSPRASVWLSLDELDNDATRFWILLVTALHACLPQAGEVALAMLQSPQPPLLLIILTTLLNELTSLERETVLILDDYQVIKNSDIHESLGFWLDHLPPSLHMVISSRVEPALPLARWRVRGQMTEIHDADLRFTAEEANSFLTQAIGHPCSTDDVVMLEQRTEGWIAGLQLAALAMRKNDDLSLLTRTFTGNHRYLLDYVQEEILQRQPLTVQQFLLQAAVLTRMNPALCQAVTEIPELQTSQEMLQALERANLFVVPLDEQHQWYRFHALFREALQASLQASQPQLVPLLHQRAARWYETQDMVHEAMAHALMASDYSFATSVMEREAPQLWLNGEAHIVSTWVIALPDTALQKHTDLALTSVLRLLDRAQNMPAQQWGEAWTQSEQIISRLKHILQRERKGLFSDVERVKVLKRIRLLYGLADTRTAFFAGNMQEVRSIAQQMQPLTEQEQVIWKKIPLFGLFVSAQVLGDLVLLLPDLLAVKQQALQEQDSYTASIVMCWLAGAFLYGGHLHTLHQECLHAQVLLEQMGSQITVAAYPDLDLAFLFYAWNKLEKAQTYLQRVIQHAQHWQDMHLLVWSYSISVKVLLAERKLAEAEQVLQEIQRLIQETGLTAYASEVIAAQVSLWLAQRNLSAAGAWADHFLFSVIPSEYIHGEEYLALARVYLAQQKYVPCLHLLAQVLSKMERMKRQWDVVHILALQIVALHCCGEDTQADQVAIRLLTLTEPEGYLRVYIDAGEPMKQVLQRFFDISGDDTVRTTTVSLAYVSTLLSAFEYDRHSLTLPLQTQHTYASYASSVLIEPLSPREQEVLRLLAGGASNQDIANQLVVSLPTVKKHVGSLLLKLTAENRTHAVARARELSLL